MEARPATPTQPPVAATPQQTAEARIGQIVGGRLSLERVLGSGGTATVYAARHRNGRALAVKILHPEFAQHAEIRRRFLAEGYAANKVDHPDVVAILDEGEGEDGSAFLVMELLRGRTLYTRLLEGGPLPARAVVAMALRVLDVLAYAHARGVVHRDVKPSNIFETDEGAIKLLDFGIARVQEGEGAFLTRPGATLGTPAFMAPELAAGRLEQLDALTDLWALGATMFQLLTADVVHPSRNDNEALVLAATAPARSLALVRPDLDPEIVSVIDRALAFERSKRWPNARAMSQALAAAAGGAGFPSNHPPPPAAAQFPTAPEMALESARAPTASSSLGIRIAAVLALVLAVVGTLVAIRYRARDVQSKTDEMARPPAPARLTAAASQLAPEPAASATREPEKGLPAAKAIAAPPLPNKRPAPQVPSAAPADHSKNPLFFPGQ